MRVSGLIVKEIPFRETSKIIHLYTRELGRISVMIKGAREPKSRLGSMTQLFAMGYFYLTEGRNFYYLKELELYSTNYSIRTNLNRLLTASYVVELIEKTAYATADQRLFDMIIVALRDIACRTRNFCAYLTAFELKWAALSGYRPEVLNCISCGKNFSSKAYFSIGEGGLVCEDCDSHGGIPLDNNQVKALIYLLYKPFRMIDDINWDEQAMYPLYLLLERYILYHIDQPFFTSSRLLKELIDLNEEV